MEEHLESTTEFRALVACSIQARRPSAPVGTVTHIELDREKWVAFIDAAHRCLNAHPKSTDQQKGAGQ